MAAGSIIVDLLMRTGSFETDTDRAAKSLKRLKDEAYKTGKGIGDAFKGVAALTGITLSVGGIAAAFTAAAQSASDFVDLAETTGTVAQDIAALSLAAGTAGVPIDAVAKSLQTMTKNLTGVDDESKAAGAALKALGLDLEKFKQLDPAAQYEELAKAMNSFADDGTSGAAKVSAAMAIMGKSGAEQIKAFKALQEQGGATVILTQRQIEQADEFFDRYARTLQVIKLTAAAYASEMLPAMTDVINVSTEVVRSLFGIQDGASALSKSVAIQKWAEDQARALGDLAGKMESLALLGKALGGSFIPKALGGDPGAGWRAYFDFDEQKYRKQIAAVQEARKLAAIQGDPTELARRGRPIAAAKQLEFAGALTPPKPPGGIAKRAVPASYQDGVAQAVGRAIENADVVRARELADQIAYLDDLFFNAGLAAEVYESAMRKLTGQTSETKDATSEFLREQERLADLLGSTASAELERQREDMQLLAKAYQEGRISVQQYTEAVQARLGQTGAQAEKTKTLAEDLGLTFTSAFEDAIVSGGKFSDVLKGLEQDLLRLITRKLVTEPLGNFITSALQGVTGGGSGGGGFFAGIGNFIGSLFGGGRAYGGPANAGSLYRVNERGTPEMLEMDGKEFLLMGNRRGWVDPNTSAGRTSSTTWSPVFNMSFAQGTSVATATQAGAAVARRIQAAAQRNG